MDCKRILRAISEVIPHFFVAMVLELAETCPENSDENSKIDRFSSLSKWNQPLSILPGDLSCKFYRGLSRWESLEWPVAEISERFEVLLALLLHQVIPRLVDCCTECPVMPDFGECWVRIFQNISIFYGPSFVKTHIHPLMTRYLGLFAKVRQ